MVLQYVELEGLFHPIPVFWQQWPSARFSPWFWSKQVNIKHILLIGINLQTYTTNRVFPLSFHLWITFSFGSWHFNRITDFEFQHVDYLCYVLSFYIPKPKVCYANFLRRNLNGNYRIIPRTSRAILFSLQSTEDLRPVEQIFACKTFKLWNFDLDILQP